MVFVRKIDFKSCVMRLNRVESFNAFTARTARRRGWPWLAARGSQLRPRPPARGRPVAAKAPQQGGCRPPARGGRPYGQQPARGAHPLVRPAHRGVCQWRAHKGRPPVSSPQGASHGATGRGDTGRNAQRRRLCRGSGDGNDARR
ncbi:hypothetical protein GW17_00038050 [Ensete ventricosum]|nr:hypothetical protein GW17_00038050 [Ensete ventricosum]